MHRDPECRIANPCEAEFSLPDRGDKIRPTGLYSMWAGSVSPTKVYAWADDFESAFEVLVEYLDKHAPGRLTNLGEDDLRVAASELGVAWNVSWEGKAACDDPVFRRVLGHAETDLTIIGHTTLNHGGYIASDEWGGDAVTDTLVFRSVLMESLRRCRRACFTHVP